MKIQATDISLFLILVYVSYLLCFHRTESNMVAIVEPELPIHEIETGITSDGRSYARVIRQKREEGIANIFESDTVSNILVSCNEDESEEAGMISYTDKAGVRKHVNFIINGTTITYLSESTKEIEIKK